MIRDTRTYVTVNAIGALGSLLLLVSAIFSPSKNALFPAWLLVTLAAVAFCGFVYQIVMKLTGRPIPLAPWARGKTDRQLWIVKSVMLACLAVVALAIIFYRR